LDTGKTIQIISPPATDFQYLRKRLGEALIKLDLRPVQIPSLCVIFEFDKRDELLNYEKYVRLSPITYSLARTTVQCSRAFSAQAAS